MEISDYSVNVRPSRNVRLVEEKGAVIAYPEPHRTPVLPAGWAPLSREQQEAVLDACDATADALIFRLGSLWEPEAEYRVYRLANELWGGLAVASRRSDGTDETRRHLLGLAWDTLGAVRIAVDFYNWDLDAHEQSFRLEVRGKDVRGRGER